MRANVQLLIDAFLAKCDEIIALHFAGPGEWGACSKLTSYAAAESNCRTKNFGPRLEAVQEAYSYRWRTKLLGKNKQIFPQLKPPCEHETAVWLLISISALRASWPLLTWPKLLSRCQEAELMPFNKRSHGHLCLKPVVAVLNRRFWYSKDLLGAIWKSNPSQRLPRLIKKGWRNVTATQCKVLTLCANI